MAPLPPAQQRSVAVVTAGHRGLGFHVARGLLSRGNDVVIACRDMNAGAKAAALLGNDPAATRPAADGSARARRRVQALQLDVCEGDSRRRFAKELKDLLGDERCLEVLVNNAGAQEKSWDAATLVHMVNTNCCGPIYLTLELLPLMKPGGCVTMVASVIGEYNRLKEPYCQTVPNATSLAQLQEAASAFVADCPHGGVFFAPYALSKAAMLRATQLLAAEEGNEVAVNAVHPGWCKTAMGGGDIAPDSPEQGAAAILHAIDEGLKGQSGCYFKGMKQVDFSSGTVNNLMLHRGGGQR